MQSGQQSAGEKCMVAGAPRNLRLARRGWLVPHDVERRLRVPVHIRGDLAVVVVWSRMPSATSALFACLVETAPSDTMCCAILVQHRQRERAAADVQLATTSRRAGRRLLTSPSCFCASARLVAARRPRVRGVVQRPPMRARGARVAFGSGGLSQRRLGPHIWAVEGRSARVAEQQRGRYCCSIRMRGPHGGARHAKPSGRWRPCLLVCVRVGMCANMHVSFLC